MKWNKQLQWVFWPENKNGQGLERKRLEYQRQVIPGEKDVKGLKGISKECEDFFG